MDTSPTLVLIEDAETDAFVVQTIAHICGWIVIWKRTLFEGWQWLTESLNIDQPQARLVVLIDMKIPDRYFQRLEGSVLATWLSHEMDNGRLHTVPIVGYTTSSNQHRQWEAKVAGCRTLLTKPITRSHFDTFNSLLDTTDTSESDFGIDTIARDIIRNQHLDIMGTIIQLGQDGRYVTPWTVAEVKALLSQMTRSVYCPRLLQNQKTQILEKAGGLIEARSRIKECLANPGMSSLQVKIINRLLHGVTQDEIAKQEHKGRRALESIIEDAFATIAYRLSEYDQG